MNYPCIKCVVEYLEANKRFRLSSRCPSIRKIERSIPLHLELLDVTSTTIRINDYRYQTKRHVVKQEKGVLNGDIVLENDRRNEDYLYYYRVLCSSEEMSNDTDDENHAQMNVNRNFEVLKIFPERVQFHHVMRWLGNFLFEGRSEITTRKLEIVNAQVLRLPVDFKIKKVGILRTCMGYLDAISEFINPMVDTIILSPYDIYDPTTFTYTNRHPVRDHPMLHTAKKICIESQEITTDVLNIAHKNIESKGAISEEDLERLIRKWIADGREIGTLFTSNFWKIWNFEDAEYWNLKDAELESLKNFETMFNGRTVYKEVENPSSETSQVLDSRQKVLMELHGLNERRTILYCTCLPMNSTSELQISLSRAHQETERIMRYPIKIILEVVPIQFWSALIIPKLDPVEEYKIENDESVKDCTPILILIIFWFFLCFVCFVLGFSYFKLVKDS